MSMYEQSRRRQCFDLFSGFGFLMWLLLLFDISVFAPANAS